MTDEHTQLRRHLILVAALPYHLPADGRARSSCARILARALQLAGLWAGPVIRAHDSFGEKADPTFDAWYGTLIDMTRATHEQPLLLDGYGNLDLPAAAQYTGCYLTAAGRAASAGTPRVAG